MADLLSNHVKVRSPCSGWTPPHIFYELMTTELFINKDVITDETLHDECYGNFINISDEK
jgi:hypothetical protein